VDLHVSFDGRTNLAGQIYQHIRAAVLDEHLLPGQSLPPSRDLAIQLGVSRNTVNVAYERLVAEGIVTARVGAGTFVSHRPLPAPTAAGTASCPLRALNARPVWAEIPVPVELANNPPFDFRVGVPDARLFPYATWRRLVSRQLRASAMAAGTPCEPAGHPGLRAAIARHIRLSRNVRTGPADILITSGAQQAIDLIGRVLLEPGACAAVEEPGNVPPRLLFTSLGARVVPVPVDAEGLVVDDLPADARVVYVTPSHQIPLGMAMSLRRREALLSWAERHDAAVIEDDCDSDFRYSGELIEPLHTLDHYGRVLYVGSFSKIMLPALRLGFLVAPQRLRLALHAAKYVTDRHTPLPTQAAVAEFIDDGGLSRHIRRMRNTYQARRERIGAALAGPLSRWLEPIPSTVGLHVSAYLRDGTKGDTGHLRRRAQAAGVGLFDFALFTKDGPVRPGIILGYGAIADDRVEEGLRRLRHCLQSS
jgi:GntR family transcriptional regulator / MocR family aminotransferase